jgi:hypothetical protein
MGYSTNPELVEQRKSLLQPLAEGRTTRWTPDSDPTETKRFVYSLREALHIAALYPHRFPELAKAAENFTIVSPRPGVVEARFKQGKTETSVSSEVATHGLEPQGKLVQQVGQVSADGIIQSWRDHLPSNDPLHFTDTRLDFEELTELHAFCRSNTPRLMILVDEELGLLTVSLFDGSIEEFAWSPPEPTPPPEKEFNL